MDLRIIYGPPGTGKTTRLLSILEDEMTTVRPDRIAFVSFTRKGTYEGRDRAVEAFRLSNSDLPYFRTLHSIAFRQAGLKKDQVINRKHYRAFSKATGMSFTGFYTEDLRHDDDRYLFFNGLYRNNPDAAEELMTELNPKILRWVTKEYKRFKSELGIYDFTDMLDMFISRKEPLPVDVAIIDEAQDLTTLQWRFIWKAFRGCKRMYIAGDDDQAIYEWSGADVSYFLNIRADSSEVLHQSWRLPSSIHEYAMRVVNQIDVRIPKTFSPNKTGGTVQVMNSFRELEIDNMSSWMILARNNHHLKIVEEWMKDRGYIFYKKEGLSFDQRTLRAIKAHTDICKGRPTSETDRLIVSTFMGEGMVSPFTKPWYEEFTRMKHEDIDYYRNIIGNKTDTENVNIRLSTIHGVKGGQADNVALIMDYSKRVYDQFGKNPDSEMRCYYVAVTRAKENLYLILPETGNGYPLIKEEIDA